jgi:hypothetical protein
MSKDTASTRRAFVKGGAILAAPLAAAAPAVALADEQRRARLQRLEDAAAIGDLHRAWLRRVNTGQDAAELFADPNRAPFDEAVRDVRPDHEAEPVAVELAADGLSASARYPCAVQVEVDIGEDCTLSQMAHAQGEGFIRLPRRGVLMAEYVKAAGVWAIRKVEFEAG